MNRKTILTALLAIPMQIFGQSLTLDRCLQMAHDNYPAIKQYRMVEQSRDFTLANAAKEWLPKVSVSAGAAAFTDLLADDMAKMGISTRNHAFSGAISVKQTLYDGGAISAGRHVAAAEATVQSRQLDVTLYDINSRVEQIYFGLILIDEQIKQSRLLQSDLATSRATVASLITGGLANETDKDAVSVEIVKAQQQEEQLAASRMAYLRMLGVFIGRNLGGETQLQKPSLPTADASLASGRNRPEMAYYDARNALVDTQRRQLNARLMPALGLFGLGAAHSRLSAMVNNTMLAAGLSLTWNIGALYTRKNDIRKLGLQRERNENLRESFLFNLRLQNAEANGAVSALRSQIEKDKDIVHLRESIRSKSEKKVSLGTETVNEMVRDINAVAMARQQQSIHEIQLLEELYRLKTINNN